MNNPDNIPSGIDPNNVKQYYQYQSMLLGIMNNLDISFSGSTGVTSSTSTEVTDALMNYFNSLGPLPTATNDVDLETFCDNAVKGYQELIGTFRNTQNEQIVVNIAKTFVENLLQQYKPYVQLMRNQIKTLKAYEPLGPSGPSGVTSSATPYSKTTDTRTLEQIPPPPFIPGTRKNSEYTDCAKELYASESAYYECEEFNKLNAPGPQKKQGTPNECFPTYGKSSPPVCAPDTTGTCTNGLMNVTGFPPCCNDNVPDSCIISPSNPYAPITPSGSVPVPPPLVNSSIYTPTPTPSENLSRAAANCVAKNPNYPAEMGSCVYNAENPCPTHYETTDTRFGTKMCCAPQSNNNANCFSTKSTFGSSGTDNTYILILLLIAILLFIFMKKK